MTSPRPKRPVRKVSIVTVTYNARDTLRLTMESVIRQSFPDIDHVIIDGGSTDGTQDIAREYELGTFVSEKDKGVYDAMDKGAKAAKGDIVIFLNAGDTFFDDNVCSDVAEFFEETDADIVFGNIMPVYLGHNDEHDHGAFRAGELINLAYLRNRSQLRDESIHHQATFYRRDVFAKSTYACVEPAGTGEYHVLMSSVFKYNAKVRYIPRNISRFALGGISTRDFKTEWERYVACRDILRRMYLGDKRTIAPPNEFEFHGGQPPTNVVRALTEPQRNSRIGRAALKHWVKKTPLFRIYERLAVGLTERVANRLLPHLEDVQELHTRRLFSEMRLLIEGTRDQAIRRSADDFQELIRHIHALQRDTSNTASGNATRIEEVFAAQSEFNERNASLLRQLDTNVGAQFVEAGTAIKRATELIETQALGIVEQINVQSKGLVELIENQAQGLSERMASHELALRKLDGLATDQRDVVNTLLVNQGKALTKLMGGDEFAEHGFKVFSQWDEDGLIQFLIACCDIPNNTFVEIGVSDYTEANTRFLAFNDNWSGLVIEGDAASVAAIKSADWYWRYAVNAVHSFVTAENINETLIANGMTGDIGLLSIDIDGVDYWIWKAIEAVSPRILICEFNGIYGAEAAVTVPYAPDFDRMRRHYSGIYAGASLRALVRLGKVKGYTFVGTNIGGNNAFFVRDDVFAKSELKPSKRGFFMPQFREARNADGSLSFAPLPQAKALIASLPIVEVTSGKTMRIGDIP